MKSGFSSTKRKLFPIIDAHLYYHYRGIIHIKEREGLNDIKAEIGNCLTLPINLFAAIEIMLMQAFDRH